MLSFLNFLVKPWGYMLWYEDMWRKSVIYTQHTCTSNHTSKNIVECSYIYRQMGQLWTLFEFACSLYLTCNMVLDMDGGISRVLLCIMIFSILRLYGMKRISNYITQHRVMLDVITYRYLLHIHFIATFICIPVKLPWIFPGALWIFNEAPGNIQARVIWQVYYVSWLPSSSTQLLHHNLWLQM